MSIPLAGRPPAHLAVRLARHLAPEILVAASPFEWVVSRPVGPHAIQQRVSRHLRAVAAARALAALKGLPAPLALLCARGAWLADLSGTRILAAGRRSPLALRPAPDPARPLRPRPPAPRQPSRRPPGSPPAGRSHHGARAPALRPLRGRRPGPPRDPAPQRHPLPDPAHAPGPSPAARHPLRRRPARPPRRPAVRTADLAGRPEAHLLARLARDLAPDLLAAATPTPRTGSSSGGPRARARSIPGATPAVGTPSSPSSRPCRSGRASSTSPPPPTPASPMQPPAERTSRPRSSRTAPSPISSSRKGWRPRPGLCPPPSPSPPGGETRASPSTSTRTCPRSCCSRR